MLAESPALTRASTLTIVRIQETDEPPPELSMAQVVGTLQLLLAARRQARCAQDAPRS